MLSIGETAKLLGISVRTLRYYDEIGLAKPSAISDSGYRYYDETVLSRLQQIIFYRELDLSLNEITNIFNNPDYDEKEALNKHKELLILKRKHLDELIKLVTEAIGGNKMSEIKITDIKKAKEMYADEVRMRWGNTGAYKESQLKYSGLSENDEFILVKEADDIFSAFSKLKTSSPNCAEAQNLVRRWQEHISKFHYNCTDEILLCLGKMYTSDDRFKINIDRFGEGTAQFMSEAIEIYCK